MNVGFYSSVSGMISYQKDMDTIAHNVANVSTVGFKGHSSVFNDLLYSSSNDMSRQPILNGNGVKNSGTVLEYRQGNLMQTDNILDFALIDDSLFALEKGERVEYTRNGSFSLSYEDGALMLVSTDGGYVLDSFGNRIQVYYQQGSNNPDVSDLISRIGTYKFENPFGLIPVGASSFIPGENTGPAVANQESSSRLKQGFIEASNVDLAKQMSDLMLTQKAFTFNSKLIQTADQLEEIINNLR